MKGKRMKAAIRPLIIALLALPVAVLAAGDPAGSEAKPADPVLASVKDFTSRKDYAGAAGVLRAALAKSPGNADYHNLYAYCLRKGPTPDMDEVFKHYNEALRIDPRHRAALEYLGEAYLMVGKPQKAREQLTQLDRLCLFGCEEYDDLKKAIAEYERTAKP
jgi:cytochrome c-type biogenesis protein CcmH/NrfG